MDRGVAVDGREPRLPAGSVRLHKERMRFVVNRVTGDQEAKRRDMQRGRVVGVGVTSVDHADLMSLQIEALSLQLRGDSQTFWNLSLPPASPTTYTPLPPPPP